MATSKLEPKALGNWTIISGSKATKDAVYGARVWDGQGTIKSGDLVALVNWKDQVTLVQVGEIHSKVEANLAKGQMSATVWTILK